MKRVFTTIGVAGLLMSFSLFLNSIPDLTGFAIFQAMTIKQSSIAMVVCFLIGVLFLVLGASPEEKVKAQVTKLEEKLGHNVEVHTTLVRHGEKDKEGKLTGVGFGQAADYGKGMDASDAIKGYGSTTQRAFDTAEEIIKNAPHGKKLSTKKKQEISMPPMSKEFFAAYVEHAKDGADNANDWYMNLKKPFDKETGTSKRVAEGLAYMVLRNNAMAGKLHDGSKVDLINGTHQTMPEALLKEVMIRNVNGKRVVGFKNLKEIGGSLGYVEPVDFVTTTDANGEKELKVNFRGEQYEVDMNKLNKLANSYRKKVKGRKHKSKF
ncbi:hypothetical protein GOV14_05485 [Candidatus Pacearchaeota archaeon]|nr:hypothetical protein [Candidatus Pacearchaeota archaeon]